MNQKKINQARRKKAENDADKHYSEFIEMIEQVYGIRRNGHQWENLKSLDRTEDHQIDEIDNSIIQSSLASAIELIGTSAIAMTDYHGQKRTALFKTAIIYYEAVEAWEHAYMMAMIAMRMPASKMYFLKIANKYKSIKNKTHSVVIDIEKLCDDFDSIPEKI